MTYDAAIVRQELLDAVAEAIDEIAKALAALGGAYELLDEVTGDRLEAELFRPVQAAYGQAQRTHAGFAERHGLPRATFSPVAPGAPSAGVKGYIEQAVAAVEEADLTLSTLQDSMMPVDVGDPELRAGLAQVRRSLADVSLAAARLVGVFGR